MQNQNLNHLDDKDEGNGVGKNGGDIEKLEENMQLEPDPVAAAKQLYNENNFPTSARPVRADAAMNGLSWGRMTCRSVFQRPNR